MTENRPSPEATLTQEQLAIQQLTTSAETVFEAHGVLIHELSGSRSVDSGGIYLTERQDADGNSRFSFWTATHSDAGISEHLYGGWEKGGSQVLADTSEDWRDRIPIDADGLVKLKEHLDTTFSTPEKPSEPTGLRGFIGRLVTKRQVRRDESAARYIAKLKAKHADRGNG
jgi:hypothetical protein